MARKRDNFVFWIVIAAWAVLIVVLNAFGLFATNPDKPPLPLLIAVVGPPVLFGIAYWSSPAVRAVSLGQDLVLITAMQGWRLIGAMFLVLMWFRMLPGTFAWPAGVGDTIVGAYAPFVTVAVARQTPTWRKHVVLLSVLGLLDFVGAIGGGVLSGRSPIGFLHGDVTTDIMQQLPLSLIPTFGVPFWTIIHIISLLKVRNSTATPDTHAR
jgi:hypothetical protein